MWLDAKTFDGYRNLGGQDLLFYFSEGFSASHKENLAAVTATSRQQHLDGLIIVGNLDAQVDAAFVAEACESQGLECSLITIPVSIDCDFPFVQQTVGYDTMCHTLSAFIGQLGCVAEAAERLRVLSAAPATLGRTSRCSAPCTHTPPWC